MRIHHEYDVDLAETLPESSTVESLSFTFRPTLPRLILSNLNALPLITVSEFPTFSVAGKLALAVRDVRHSAQVFSQIDQLVIK
jgi:hypothetical protein